MAMLEERSDENACPRVVRIAVLFYDRESPERSRGDRSLDFQLCVVAHRGNYFSTINLLNKISSTLRRPSIMETINTISFSITKNILQGSTIISRYCSILWYFNL